MTKTRRAVYKADSEEALQALQVPFKEAKALVQSRIPAHQLKALQNANVDVPELIRKACEIAYDSVRAETMKK